MERREFVIRGIGAMAVGAGVAGGLLACGGDDTGVGPGNENGNGNGDEEPFDGTITLTSANTFDPANVTIDVGDTITWENGGDIYHTITPDGHSEWTRREMNDQGETFEVTFNNTGSFDYFCEPHSPGMSGTITVE